MRSRSSDHREVLLLKAHTAAGSPRSPLFTKAIDRGDLHAAAAHLIAVADSDPPDPSFWRAMATAVRNLQMDELGRLCHLRAYEAAHGWVEASLTLTDTHRGGRARPVFTDYRPDWDIGNRTETGQLTINGAPITLEDADKLAPGETGIVRLHPFHRPAWTNVEPDMIIAMHEGARVVGTAVVLTVTLQTVAMEKG